MRLLRPIVYTLPHRLPAALTGAQSLHLPDVRGTQFVTKPVMHPIQFSAVLVAALCAGSVVPSCLAQAYPVKPVRFVVAYPAGAHADQVARLIGQKLTESMGRQFVVDNKGGAGGIIAEEIASRAAPDGYTILLASISHVVNPIMIEKLAYRPMRDERELNVRGPPAA